jgi:hypothetical protein
LQQMGMKHIIISRLVLVWKLRRAAFHSRRAIDRYGNLPFFPDRN